MRQLRLTRPPAYDTAAQAEAWQLLLSLPIPTDLPAFTHAAFSEQGRRFILAVTQQYPGHSLPQLAQVGFEALVASARQYREQPELWERFGVWAVQQGVLKSYKLG